MLIIQEILVSDDIVSEQFVCNLNACKGACCWEGDLGAPLEADEMETLKRIYEDIKPFLTPEGIAVIEQEGLYTWYAAAGDYGTPLIDGAACVYLTYNELGIAQCGIEKAFLAGATDFRKPISCHLYPIRVKRNEELGFEALNYDRWDICSAACTLGKSLKMPVYQFLKDALIRKYGEDFYEELEAGAEYMNNREIGKKV